MKRTSRAFCRCSSASFSSSMCRWRFWALQDRYRPKSADQSRPSVSSSAAAARTRSRIDIGMHRIWGHLRKTRPQKRMGGLQQPAIIISRSRMARIWACMILCPIDMSHIRSHVAAKSAAPKTPGFICGSKVLAASELPAVLLPAAASAACTAAAGTSQMTAATAAGMQRCSSHLC